MENKTKEINILIDVANAIDNNNYEIKDYNLENEIDSLYYIINNILKNSEDIATLETKVWSILNISCASDADDDSIIEFETLEYQKIWDNLSPWLHNGYSDSAYNDEWVNQVYPNDKPEFYGVYRMRGY
mgnify:FL=1